VNGIHEVGGSIPPGSTNLRGLRPLRFASQTWLSGEASEGCRAEGRRRAVWSTPIFSKVRSASTFALAHNS